MRYPAIAPPSAHERALSLVVYGDTPIYGDPCWVYTGYRNHKGYGWIRAGSRGKASVHRVVYEALVGPIPDGLLLDHLCRVRSCCNPAHLEPVTQWENTRRGVSFSATNAAKTRCPQGHEYDAVNTYVHVRTNRRHCRACQRDRDRRRAVARNTP